MINKSSIYRRFTIAGTAFVLLSVISGCVTLQNTENAIDVSQFSNLTTVDAVKKLEVNYKQSAEDKLNIFAPDHYSIAGKALVDARLLISKNKPREQIVQKVAVASAMLRNGDVVMRKVKDILEAQLVSKEKLDALKSNKVYRSEYGSLDQRLNTIIRDIEKGQLSDNETSRSQLLKDMQNLERRSIRYNAMHEPEEILKRVKYRNGEVLAPLTYQDALAVFLRAEDFITQNPNYETGIEQMGAEALFAAKRALYITEQVAALSQKVNFSLEQVILDEEYRLYRISRALDSVDLRNHPLEMQSEQLAKLALDKAEEYENKEGLIIALRDTLIKVRDSSTELSALSEISIKLKQEKNEWITKEARYKAQVSHLEKNLSNSQHQLDQTQQTLLSFKDENIGLTHSLNLEKEASATLKVKISEAELKIDVVKFQAAQQKALEDKALADQVTENKILESKLRDQLIQELSKQELDTQNNTAASIKEPLAQRKQFTRQEELLTFDTQDTPPQTTSSTESTASTESLAGTALKQPLTLTTTADDASSTLETKIMATETVVTEQIKQSRDQASDQTLEQAVEQALVQTVEPQILATIDNKTISNIESSDSTVSDSTVSAETLIEEVLNQEMNQPEATELSMLSKQQAELTPTETNSSVHSVLPNIENESNAVSATIVATNVATNIQTLPEPIQRPSSRPRKKITEQETIDALDSIMELIKQFEPKNELSSMTNTSANTDGTGFADEAFVDAGE